MLHIGITIAENPKCGIPAALMRYLLTYYYCRNRLISGGKKSTNVSCQFLRSVKLSNKQKQSGRKESQTTPYYPPRKWPHTTIPSLQPRKKKGTRARKALQPHWMMTHADFTPSGNNRCSSQPSIQPATPSPVASTIVTRSAGNPPEKTEPFIIITTQTPSQRPDPVENLDNVGFSSF